MINSDSYPLFQYQGENLLFDVNTNSLSVLNNFSYRFLELAGKYSRPEVIEILEQKFPDNDFKEADKIVDKLRSKGFFTHQPIDIVGQKSNLKKLWEHRPRRLQLFLAQHCNLKCKYCYGENNESNTKHQLMTFEVAKTAVDHLIKRAESRKDLQITFFGGEPTLNFKVMKQVVKYCKKIESKTKKSFVFELITNGILVEGEIAEFVLKHNFLLFVSLDGWREMNNFQRPSVDGKDYYDKILYNAQYLVMESRRRKSKYQVKIRTNLTSQFYDVKAVANFLESFGFKLIGIGAIMSLSWNSKTTPMALSENQLNELEKVEEKMMIQALSNKIVKKRLLPYINRRFNKRLSSLEKIRNTMGIICGIGRNTNAVDCDGNIFPCHRYVGMDSYIIGNIFDGLDSKKTTNLYMHYNDNTIKNCSHCWARKSCAGGCPWEMSHPNGTICKRLKSDCDRKKRWFEKNLWFRKEMRKYFPKRFDEKDFGKDTFNFWKWGN